MLILYPPFFFSQVNLVTNELFTVEAMEKSAEVIVKIFHFWYIYGSLEEIKTDFERINWMNLYLLHMTPLTIILVLCLRKMIRNIYLPGVWKFPKMNCDICFYQDVVDENGDISQVNMKHEW